MASPLRLIDLHCDWLLQYAAETTVFDPTYYPEIVQARAERSPYFRQAEGYLQGTSATVIACFRNADDWASQPDPWQALGTLIARIEAEFSGRVLIGPAEHERWRDDTDGLCWAMIGVEGFDALIRAPGDLERLGALFERGVRVFQPVYEPTSLLAGAAREGDDRGLTPFGREFLDRLAGLAPPGGSMPILDLAHMNPRAAADTLDWFEADAARTERLIPIYSHGAVENDGFRHPRALSHDNLKRLRALGGTVGFSLSPPFYATAELLKRSILEAAELPFRGQPGVAGLAIGSDFLGVDSTLPGLGNAEEVVAWITSEFDPETAGLLRSGSAAALLARASGSRCPTAELAG